MLLHMRAKKGPGGKRSAAGANKSKKNVGPPKTKARKSTAKAKKVTPAKIDIRGVAARARVSIATVSRAVNLVPTVDPVLAARVWAAVEELNYFPNTQARALVSGKSRLLGLIVSEITNPFFPELIHEFELAAVAHGYEILIGSTNYEKKTTEQCGRRMLERQVDGVAIMTFGVDETLFDRFIADEVPVVFIDAAPLRPLSNALAVDYRTGINEGVQHLAVLGHRKIGFISGPLRLRSAQARKTAFLDCLHAAGIKSKDAWLIEGDHTLAGGRDAMEKVLALKDRPTAIMCSNDMTAIGVQHALFEASLSVPQDFSLIGFDDIHLAEYTIPPLTTVRMSCKDIATKAVSSLLGQLKLGTSSVSASKAEAAQASRIPTSLVVRRTTDVPRDSMLDLASANRKGKLRR
jgi:LacI family transcriptional regulator